MTRAAHYEIRRHTRLHEGTELELMLLTDRTFLSAAERAKVDGLERRKLQLQERIAWFEAILHEHEQREDSAAE